MDLLSDILLHLKFKGTLYFRTSFTSPWSVGVPQFSDVARFHFVHKGRCLVRVQDNPEPVVLEQGDIIIITRGVPHTLYSDQESELPVTQVDQVIEQSGFTGKGALVFGEFGSSHETQLVCGHFAFEEHTNHPIKEALPPYIHIKNYGESSGSWLENTLRVIGAEAGQQNLGSDIIALKLSEIIFTQVIRSYLETDGQSNASLAGYTDVRIAKALEAIHTSPSHNWTLDELASVAGMSRTSFSNTFTQLLSLSPVVYMTRWRMELARQQLLDTNQSLIDIAENAGYQSEAAFSRVFKKHFSIAPATYRRTNRQSQAVNQ